MRHQSRNVDALIARIAGRSKGIVTRRELRRVGVTASELRTRIARGSLHREYPGVYSVGHRAASVEARYLAAVRACGEGAVLCGFAAAWLWGLLKGKPPPPEVSAPTERRIKGVRTRRRRLHPDERVERRGIPVTSLVLTLVDVAPALPISDLALACHEAGVKHHATPRQVEAALVRRPNAPGAGKLRAVIHGDEPVLLSRLEQRFFALLQQDGLPLPVTNKPKGSHRVDCRWPDHRLTVELQSYRFHNSRHSWAADHHRRREAFARGDQFRQYTWDDTEDPRLMLRELRQLLGA
jgi:hypothetical protein